VSVRPIQRGLAGTGERLLVRGLTRPSAVSAPAVPSFSNVTLLVGFNGTDGQTTFTDESEDARTISVFGDAQVDTAVKKFGTGSLLLDGTGDKLTVPDSDDFEANQVLTVETIVRFNFLSAALQTIAGKRNSGTTNSWTIYKHFISSTDVLNVQVYKTGSVVVNLIGTTELFIDTDYHVAYVVEADGTHSIWLDGLLEASAMQSDVPTASNVPLSLGFDESINGRYLNGHLDEFRVTTGEAVYTEPFTPPTMEFPRS